MSAVKRVFSNIGWLILCVAGYSVILAIAGLAIVFSFMFGGWGGIVIRLVVVDIFIYVLRLYFYESEKRMDSPAASVIFFASQAAYLVLYLMVIWLRNTGFYVDAVPAFLREIQVTIPYFLNIFIDPFGITQQYLGMENIILSLLACGALVFAAVTTDTLNSKEKRDPNFVFIRLIIIIISIILSLFGMSARGIGGGDGMTREEVDRYNEGVRRDNAEGWRGVMSGLSDMIRYLLLFAVYLFYPVLTLAVVVIYHIIKKINKPLAKRIALIAIIAAYAGFTAFRWFFPVADEGFSKIFTPPISEIKICVDDWNAQTPELYNNYSMKLKRLGSWPWQSVEVRQIRESGRTIRYYNVKDDKLAWTGECWVVTENGATTVYRKEKEIIGYYKPGHPNYQDLLDGLNVFMLDVVAERWLPFYTDEKFGILMQNQAADDKLILFINKEEFQAQGLQYKIDKPAEFYLTDNKITIFDLYLRDRLRADVTYGNAVIELPGDLDKYPKAPEIGKADWQKILDEW